MAKSVRTMFCCLMVMMGFMSSYSNRSGCPDELTPVIYNGLCGYVDLKGEFDIEPQFDSPSYFFNNVAFVEKDRRLGVIDRSGRVVCDFKNEQTELPYYSFHIPF